MPDLKLGVGNVSVMEGNSSSRAVSFVVALSGPSTTATTVDYRTLDGTTKAGSDYTAKSGTLTIPAGATSGRVAVNVKGDSTVEPNEKFTLKIQHPSAGATIERAVATATILNDDPPKSGIRIPGADPVGNLEVLQRTPAGVHIQGWTVDPSKDSPTAVDIYVNGVGFARIIAKSNRPDVAAAFSAVGANHGFAATLPIRGGTVCVYAINIGAGTRNPLLGCRTVPGPNPIAIIDSINRQPDGLHLRGWTLDPDSTAPTFLDVYADAVGVAHLTANGNRPDIAAAYPGYGSAHGFDAVLPGVGGNVCVYAINLGAGQNTSAGCRSFLPAHPVGSLDSATRTPYGIRVTGWALDADTTAADNVDIYANGVGVARIPAGQARNDVGRVYPAYGIFRGFDYTVPIAGGQVCAYGVNAGPGGNVLLGCRNA